MNQVHQTVWRRAEKGGVVSHPCAFCYCALHILNRVHVLKNVGAITDPELLIGKRHVPDITNHTTRLIQDLRINVERHISVIRVASVHPHTNHQVGLPYGPAIRERLGANPTPLIELNEKDRRLVGSHRAGTN
jgi:hypothetical protein